MNRVRQLVIAREFGFASWPRLTEALTTGPGVPSVAPGLGTGSREPSVSPPLMFERAVASRALEPGQVVVLDGSVVEVGPAPERAGRVRIAIVTAMGPPPGDRGLALEDIVGVEGLDPGRIIVFDGEVLTCEPDAPGFVRLVIRIARSRRELDVVCPADMEIGAARRGEPRGPRFDKALDAERLEVGQVVVVDGRVLETGPDPEDASRVRLVLVTVLGPPPGDDPDQREMVLSCPRDMNFGTAIPHNLDRQLRALRRAVDRLEARKPRHSSWRVPLDRSSRCLDHQTGSTHPERARSRS